MDALWKERKKEKTSLFVSTKTIAAYLSYFSTTGYCKCLMVQTTLWNAFCFEVHIWMFTDRKKKRFFPPTGESMEIAKYA